MATLMEGGFHLIKVLGGAEVGILFHKPEGADIDARATRLHPGSYHSI
jgi:hypothetical protein